VFVPGRHHAGVRRDQARDMAIEALRFPGDEVVGRVPVSSGSLQWISKYGASMRRKTFSPLSERDAGAISATSSARARDAALRSRC